MARGAGRARPAKEGGKSKKENKKSMAESAELDDMEEGAAAPAVVVDQLDLSEEELAREHVTSYTAANPNLGKNRILYDHKEHTFQPLTEISHMMVHFTMESIWIHKESDEAKEQGVVVASEEDGKKVATQGDATAATSEAGAGPDEKEDKESVTKAALPATSNGLDNTLKNQFNFSDRASQTFNKPMRDKDVQTEPPPMTKFKCTITRDIVFDAYYKAADAKLAAKREAEKRPAGARKEEKEKDDGIQLYVEKDSADKEVFKNPRLLAAAKIIERIVNQSSLDDQYHNLKYYEDPQDISRSGGKGSLKHLFTCTYTAAKKMSVTAMVWNKRYYDMFGVGYGSYDFAKQGQGLFCVYTLKNTSHPEFVFTVDSGVMCMDFHPEHHHILAVGLYNGSVMVFDVRSKENTPLYESTDPRRRHTDPVWQVRWGLDDVNKNLNFTSISSDGRMVVWTMKKSELHSEDLVHIKMLKGKSSSDGPGIDLGPDGTKPPAEDEEGMPEDGEDAATEDLASSIGELAGACCFDINPNDPSLILVGTEEGEVHTYTSAFNCQFNDAYESHHMAVYAVRWNPFAKNVFCSCSADWQVRIWELSCSKPVMTFDLNADVGDVVWSPFSSTVFSCVTSDGTLRVFDLNINKHEPVGQYRVRVKKDKKARLTHCSFNPVEFIVLSGDERGDVGIFKLSPNLRRMTANTIVELDPKIEAKKIEDLLILKGKESTKWKPSSVSGVISAAPVKVVEEDAEEKNKGDDAE